MTTQTLSHSPSKTHIRHTKDTSLQFEKGPSLAHIALLEKAAAERGCTCKPYVDWLTYERWQGQGMQVQRGEHGVFLTTYPRETWKDDKGVEHSRSFPKGTRVFCRCQVKPKGWKPETKEQVVE